MIFRALIVLCAIYIAQATLTCYFCGSPPQDNCKDPFNKTGIEKCSGNYDYCAKEVYKGIYGRGCVTKEQVEEARQRIKEKGIRNITLDICSTNLCNGK